MQAGRLRELLQGDRLGLPGERIEQSRHALDHLDRILGSDVAT